MYQNDLLTHQFCYTTNWICYKMIIEQLKTLFKYRELLSAIIIRDIKIRYKQSVLGVSWAILQPLSLMIIFTIVFSKFTKVPTNGIPYPIFSYCGLLPWTFFATSLTFAIPSLINNITLVTKIYFPREIFPIAAVAACFFDFLVASVIFIFMMLYYKVAVSITILLVPLLFIIQILFTLSVVFVASTMNVFFRDIRYIVPLGVQLWMFLSPVIYPNSVVPEKFQLIYSLNPMAVLLDGYRSVILTGEFPSLKLLGLACFIAMVTFLYSYKIFKHYEMKFADVI